MTNESLEKLTEKVLKFALEKYQGIFSPKMLIDNDILENYQQWSRVLKKLKKKENYELKEIKTDELKIYNKMFLNKELNLADEREKFYLIINPIEKKKIETYTDLILKENDIKKKINLVKTIIDPSQNYVNHLSYLKLSDIESLLESILSLQDYKNIYNDEFSDKLFENYLASFFIKCGELYNLENDLKKRISSSAFDKFKREKENYLKNQINQINEMSILMWYDVVVIISPKGIQISELPNLSRILEWGEEDLKNLENIENYDKNKFINFYKNLLIHHINNIDEIYLIKQKLELDYKKIIESRINAKTEAEKDFYLLFENLDNLYKNDKKPNKIIFR